MDDLDDLGWIDAACVSALFGTPPRAKPTAFSYRPGLCDDDSQLDMDLQPSDAGTTDAQRHSEADVAFSFVGLSSPSDVRLVPQSTLSDTQVDVLSMESQTAVEDEAVVAGAKRAADDQENTFRGGTQPQPREAIISQIENTILSLVERIALGKHLGLPTCAPSTRGRKALKSSSKSANKRSHVRNTPCDSSLEMVKRSTVRKFTRRLRVLQIMHESIVQNVVVSKRDIFYRDVELFETQKVIITGWSSCFNVPRSTLHVTASSKGLIYGAARIVLKNGKKLDCTTDVHTDDNFCSDEQGVLIPPVNQITQVDSVATFVLIIEKEASFRHLVSTGFSRVFPTAILITGRGYPDIATRHLLKYLSICHAKLPILAFVDFDPYGLDIYSVYKWGSRAQAFDALNLAVPKIQHIGLTSKDRLRYKIPDQVFIPLTHRDRRKALKMTLHTETDVDGSSQLVQPDHHLVDHQPSSYLSFVQEVSTMLHLNLKCELQALCHDSQFGMLDCLRNKIPDSLKAASPSV